MSVGKIEGRRKAFAEKVAEGHTATEAYLLADYRPAKRETAHRAASRLYSNPGVRAYIQELRRTGDELAREETTLTIARKLTFLARLVLTSSATLREDDPLIQSHRILKDGTASIRIPCKLKALKMHSELAGHFLPAPTPPSEPTDPLQELFDQIRRGINDAHHAGDRSSIMAPVQQEHERATAFPLSGNIGPLAPKQASSPPPKQPCKPLPTTTNRVGDPLAGRNTEPIDPVTAAEPEAPVMTPVAQEHERSEKHRTAPNSITNANPTRAPTLQYQRDPPDKPVTPAQARKAIVSQLQQSSPIRHLYQTETSVENVDRFLVLPASPANSRPSKCTPN